MTIPTLSDDQRHALGRLIWAHVDGVTANVHTLLHAINRDVICGVRVVATHEWDRANAALRTLQDLTKQLEEIAPGIGVERVEQLLSQLRDVAETTTKRIDPKPTRTPIY